MEHNSKTESTNQHYSSLAKHGEYLKRSVSLSHCFSPGARNILRMWK